MSQLTKIDTFSIDSRQRSGKQTITVAVERVAAAPPERLIDRIWSGTEWNLGRPGVKGLAIEYDDGKHQSVHICADWRGQNLTMSVMRFREGAGLITFFYSRLPPGVSRQSGIWEAYAHQEGCRVRFTRSLQLQRGKAEDAGAFHAREEAFGDIIKQSMALSLDDIMREALVHLKYKSLKSLTFT
jgi:hypothetical protein